MASWSHRAGDSRRPKVSASFAPVSRPACASLHIRRSSRWKTFSSISANDRAKCAYDKRALKIEPASWSTSKRAKLTEALVTTESRLLAPLSAKERATLLELLSRVLAGLEPAPRRARKT
jgi:hypothetical protein